MNLFLAEFYDTEARLNEEESKHVAKVLRMNIGDEIHLTDGRGTKARAEITSISKKQIHANILEQESYPEPQHKVNLYVAPPKSTERWEFILEKATEIGVWSIQPIFTHHSERHRVNVERASKIVLSAMKQSLKYHLPQIHEPITFEQALDKTNGKTSCLFHCQADYPRKELYEFKGMKAKEINLFIGPEGDFSNQEIQRAQEKGFRSITLGNIRLRTETAAILAVWEAVKSL